MEKKDYLNLSNQYSFLADYEEKYRKELLLYINAAFDKHGGEFELKPEGCDTWQERQKEEDFYVMDELPYYVDISEEDDNAHETHITRIVQTDRTCYKAIEVDGWDWLKGEWVQGREVSYNIDTLRTVADFINAVLEQEQTTE